jgi:hypothetical protein
MQAGFWQCGAVHNEAVRGGTGQQGSRVELGGAQSAAGWPGSARGKLQRPTCCSSSYWTHAQCCCLPRQGVAEADVSAPNQNPPPPTHTCSAAAWGGRGLSRPMRPHPPPSPQETYLPLNPPPTPLEHPPPPQTPPPLGKTHTIHRNTPAVLLPEVTGGCQGPCRPP